MLDETSGTLSETEMIVAVTGPKPTGRAILSGNKPRVDTTDVVNVPFEGAKPELPEEREMLLKSGDVITVPMGRATVEWWAKISSMPHCVLWADSDWQYALDTAKVHAMAQNGVLSAMAELRMREKTLGTTWEARRDLRIRYVEPEVEETKLAVVEQIDDRRQRLLDA